MKLPSLSPFRLLLAALLFVPSLLSAQDVTSPDGKMLLSFSLTDGGVPTYSVSFGGKAVVLPSTLGIQLAKGGEDLTGGFTIQGTATSTFDETWTPVWGEESAIRNHYNELEVTLQQPSTQRTMVLRFRVYDDGVGLRYEFPRQKDLTYFTIKEELTQFRMSGDHKAWWIPGDYDSQEYSWTTSRLSEIRSLMPAVVDAHKGNASWEDILRHRRTDHHSDEERRRHIHCHPRGGLR